MMTQESGKCHLGVTFTTRLHALQVNTKAEVILSRTLHGQV